MSIIRYGVVILLGALAVGEPIPVLADACSPIDYNQSVSWAGTIGLSSSTLFDSDLNEAAGYWNDCANAGSGFPRFGLGSGDISIGVNWSASNAPGSCGQFQAILNSVGRLTGGTVTVWNHDSQGRSCYPYSDTIAHELGHALGLANAGSSCTGRIMGPRQDNGDGTLGTRWVSSDDCSTAGDRWATPSESGSGTPPGGGLTPGCEWNSCTPIVIDLDGRGFRFTGLDAAVYFDVDADGTSEHLAWTDRQRAEVFLALDRNGNGQIDDGAELFGAATPQPVSSEPNGFMALGVFDLPSQGGNGDGLISAADAVFESLRLWLDVNHDARSQPDELTPLAEQGIEALELATIASERRDRYGNRLHWAAFVHFAADGRRLAAVDVVFVVE